jgi:hypothetical protein
MCFQKVSFLVNYMNKQTLICILKQNDFESWKDVTNISCQKGKERVK